VWDTSANVNANIESRSVVEMRLDGFMPLKTEALPTEAVQHLHIAVHSRSSSALHHRNGCNQVGVTRRG
jgi:hypothetical protein